jgi:hypothetical protein
VIGICVHVEQRRAGGGREPFEHLGLPPLGQVDDALEHSTRLTAVRARETGRRAGH